MGSSESAFAEDIAQLRAQALREKYKREASSHRNMKRRCKGAGWSLHPQWEDFRTFLRDMGPAPSDDHSLDRIDSTLKEYGPGLARWATKVEQTRNRKNTVWLDYDGERMTLAEFSTRTDVPYTTAHSALGRGESPQDIAFRKHQPPVGQRYAPARLTDPEALAKWYEAYGKWRGRVRRDRLSQARPEVFDITQISYAIFKINKKLASPAILEMTRDDVPESGSVLTQQEQDFLINGDAWIKRAVKSIFEVDVKLAGEFWPRTGPNFAQMWRFSEWLMKRDEEAF